MKLWLSAAAFAHGEPAAPAEVHHVGYAVSEVFGHVLPSWNICSLSAAFASLKAASRTCSPLAWPCCVSTREYVASPIMSIIAIANIAIITAMPVSWAIRRLIATSPSAS